MLSAEHVMKDNHVERYWVSGCWWTILKDISAYWFEFIQRFNTGKGVQMRGIVLDFYMYLNNICEMYTHI